VSDDKRRFKGATDYLDVDWRDISAVTNALIVESASLRGITRRLTIGAEESSSVARDVADVYDDVRGLIPCAAPSSTTSGFGVARIVR
jgi:hypothetical protein